MDRYYSARPKVRTETIVANRRDMDEFAAHEGYALGEVFAEAEEKPDRAFEALLSSAQRRHVEAVLIPAMSDLGIDPNTQRATKARLREAGLNLLVLDVGSA